MKHEEIDKINNDIKYIFQICLNVLGGLLFTALGTFYCKILIIDRVFIFFTLISPFILLTGINSFFAVFGYERVQLQVDCIVFKAVFGSKKRVLYYNDMTEWEEVYHGSGKNSWRELILYTKNESETYEIRSYLLFEANYIALKKLLTEIKPEKQPIVDSANEQAGIFSYLTRLIPLVAGLIFCYFAWVCQKDMVLNLYVMPSFFVGIILVVISFIQLYNHWTTR